MILIETSEAVNKAYSYHCLGFEYRTGEYVYPDSFDDIWSECSKGNIISKQNKSRHREVE